MRHACASQPWWVCQALISRNVKLNATVIAAGGGSAEAVVLAWGVTDPCALPGAWSAPDLVIAADVVYHRELFQPLLATLAAFGAPRWFRVTRARANPGDLSSGWPLLVTWNGPGRSRRASLLTHRRSRRAHAAGPRAPLEERPPLLRARAARVRCR